MKKVAKEMLDQIDKAEYALQLMERMAASVGSDIDTVMAGLDEQLQPLPDGGLLLPVKPKRKKINESPLRDVILNLFEGGRVFSTKDMAAAVANTGYKSKAKDFHNMVYQGLAKLRGEGKIVSFGKQWMLAAVD